MLCLWSGELTGERVAAADQALQRVSGLCCHSPHSIPRWCQDLGFTFITITFTTFTFTTITFTTFTFTPFPSHLKHLLPNSHALTGPSRRPFPLNLPMICTARLEGIFLFFFFFPCLKSNNLFLCQKITKYYLD